MAHLLAWPRHPYGPRLGRSESQLPAASRSTLWAVGVPHPAVVALVAYVPHCGDSSRTFSLGSSHWVGVGRCWEGSAGEGAKGRETVRLKVAG
jgi:hypothetical protein